MYPHDCQIHKISETFKFFRKFSGAEKNYLTNNCDANKIKKILTLYVHSERFHEKQGWIGLVRVERAEEGGRESRGGWKTNRRDVTSRLEEGH